MTQGHEFWLVSRSAGVVALLLVAASVLIGLTLAAGLGGPPPRRRALVAFHEHAANGSIIAIVVHGAALLGDGFLRPGLSGVTIPFVIDYRPAYVAAGIASGYLAAILGLSFYARKRIGGKRWRKLHRATPVVYVLGLVHTLGAGTDASAAWLRAVMVATAVPAVALLLVRVGKSRKRTRRAARARCTSSSA
jgi:sulfoxide reductase heme-binding subunit YedZ